MSLLPSAQARAQIIDGKACAQALLNTVAKEVTVLREQGIHPALAVILVGDDPASAVYVRNKIRQAENAGITSHEYRFNTALPQAELLATIARLNQDPAVNGILVQLPLPPQINEHAVIRAISPLKDVDGFHHENVGGLVQGCEVLTPCTPLGCMRLLQAACPDLDGKHAVVIGRSNIVGKPMAALLLQAHCSVTVLHSRSANARQLASQADILVVAVGRANMVDAEWIKPGAVVIDVGINRWAPPEGGTRLVGDVDFASASRVAGAITPVPGGVGPMTIACLMQNTVTATRLQLQAALLPTVS
ncbi:MULTISPECIES: bifunctional methylenetetrahydrofolate dehydrogenase/methenyltetrahydrofolate cyclohydrolase FolD [Gibbsiella]|uniref:Bifunctional protein FolD n=1 Tax=Gibbsiella dentisursi TaxID=796890 RepID=A0ABP7KRY3_9GAMM|nr:bifunctional methylenetetrahydrofolate dehydrogenase/methenyltetrahydrofolate cyclohydrolase FolD [Gibbsiella quercinecans]